MHSAKCVVQWSVKDFLFFLSSKWQCNFRLNSHDLFKRIRTTLDTLVSDVMSNLNVYVFKPCPLSRCGNRTQNPLYIEWHRTHALELQYSSELCRKLVIICLPPLLVNLFNTKNFEVFLGATTFCLYNCRVAVGKLNRLSAPDICVWNINWFSCLCK